MSADYSCFFVFLMFHVPCVKDEMFKLLLTDCACCIKKKSTDKFVKYFWYKPGCDRLVLPNRTEQQIEMYHNHKMS